MQPQTLVDKGLMKDYWAKKCSHHKPQTSVLKTVVICKGICILQVCAILTNYLVCTVPAATVLAIDPSANTLAKVGGLL